MVKESIPLADEKRPDVSIFVPALNEEGNVTPFVEKVAKTFADRELDGEIVLVNDGSTDGTRREAEACAARYPFVHIINHARPLGITEAMRQGFRRAAGEVIVFLPCDLESDPEEDIPKLLDKLDEGYDVVAGWRQGKRTHNVLVSKIYNAVSRRLFDLEIHDMDWIKAFRREVVESIHLRSDWHRFIVVLAAAHGFRVGEVKVNYYPRRRGKSKSGFARLPVTFFDVLVVRFLLTFSRKPMLFFGSLGSLLLAVAGGLGVYLFYLWLTIETQKRPIFNFTIFLASAGLLLFLIGFVAELVVSQTERLDDIERRLEEMAKRSGDGL